MATPSAVLDRDRVETTLRRLVEDGVLAPDQARAVRDTIAEGAEPPRLPRGAGMAAVAASYVGVGLVVAAGMTVVAQNWADMSVLARAVLFGGLAALLVTVGALLGGTLDRARGLVWLLAAGAAGAFGAALFSGRAEAGGRMALAAGVAGLAAAVPLAALRRCAPQAFAVTAACVATSVGIGVQLGFGIQGIGTLLWIAGFALGAAAVTGLLPAETFSVATAGVVALYGALMVFGDAPALGTAFGGLLAAAGYVLSLRRDQTVALALATITVAVMAPAVFGRWLNTSIGVSGVLALSGLVILAAVALHVRLVHRRTGRGT